MPVKTTEEAKNLINRWLISRGLTPKEAVYTNATFQIESKTPTGIGFAIIQPVNLSRSVFVTTKVDVDPMHSKALKLMSPEERIGFVWKLKRELLAIPPGFLCQPTGGPEVAPESIQFMKEISFDELTEGRLIEAMDQTCRGVILTAWMFLEKFGPVEA